jgi:N-acetylglutamate synthase
VSSVRYRLEVRLSAADVGNRVVIRWRRPAGNGEEIADVLGVLAAAGAASFTVRKISGEVVTIPRDRALAGKTVPAAPRRERGTGTGRWGDAPVRSG